MHVVWPVEVLVVVEVVLEEVLEIAQALLVSLRIRLELRVVLLSLLNHPLFILLLQDAMILGERIDFTLLVPLNLS